MSGCHRRVMVDGPFDKTLWLVIEALVRDGFTIKTTHGDSPVRGSRGGSRRHILLEATHAQVTAEALKAGLSSSLLLRCRIAVYELSAKQTAIVVPDAVAPATCFPGWQKEPVLAAAARDADHRITRTLEAVAHRPAPCLAVA